MKTKPKRLCWSKSVIRALVDQDAAAAVHLHPIIHNQGDDYRIFVSVVSLLPLLEETAPERMEQIKAALDELCAPTNPLIERVSCSEFVADKAASLMLRAQAKGWQVSWITACELASADLIGAIEYHTYDPELKKFSEITATGLRIKQPERDQHLLGLTVSQPRAEAQVASPNAPLQSLCDATSCEPKPRARTGAAELNEEIVSRLVGANFGERKS